VIGTAVTPVPLVEQGENGSQDAIRSLFGYLSRRTPQPDCGVLVWARRPPPAEQAPGRDHRTNL